MKQTLLLVFIFLSSFGILNAQDFTISPDGYTLDTSVNILDIYDSGKIHTSFTNNTSSDVELRWEIVQMDGPTTWRPQLCVNNESGSCFAWDILSNTDPALPQGIPFLVDAGESSLFDLGVRPNGIPGCGTYEIRVSPFDDPTNISIIGTYYFRFNVDANCESTATKNFDKTTVKLFPNPTNDYFTITDNSYVAEIQIFNIVGKQMTYTPFQSGDAINVSSFPNGLYLVRMLDDDGDVLKTTRLTKR